MKYEHVYNIRWNITAAGAALGLVVLLACGMYFLWRRQVERALRKEAEQRAARLAVPRQAATAIQASSATVSFVTKHYYSYRYFCRAAAGGNRDSGKTLSLS